MSMLSITSGVMYFALLPMGVSSPTACTLLSMIVQVKRLAKQFLFWLANTVTLISLHTVPKKFKIKALQYHRTVAGRGIYFHTKDRESLFTGLDYWTHPKWPFPAFSSVGEKLIMFVQPTSLLHLVP